MGTLDGSIVNAILTAAGTILVTAIGVTWKLSGLKGELDRRIDAAELALAQKEAELRGSIMSSVDEASRAMGEGMAALRQKAADMEIWGRDNYVRRSDFQNVVDSFTRSIEALRADINTKYQRLNDKLDRVIRGIKEEKDR